MTHPRDLGLDFSNWTAKAAKNFIKNTFNKLISIETVIRIFHRQNLTLSRPRHRLVKGNPKKQQKFFDELRSEISQAGPKDRYFFFDACSVQRSATITRKWAEKGTQPEVKITGGRKRKHIIGVLETQENRGLFMFKDRLKAEGFIDFLKALMKEYPKEHLHVILDNARAHHAKLVQKFEQKHKSRLELKFLPPYSPNLNPIEKFWKFLRKEVTHNTYFPNFTNFEQEIASFLKKFKQPCQKIQNLCKAYYHSGAIAVKVL